MYSRLLRTAGVQCEGRRLFGNAAPPNRQIPKLARSQSFRIDPENETLKAHFHRKTSGDTDDKTQESKNQDMTSVIITGAAGNLGQKAAKRLLASKNVKYNLILMDNAPCPDDFKQNEKNGHKIQYVQCDFSKYDKSWAGKFESAFASFLFAARNPQPDASAKDMYNSMKIYANLFEACANGKTGRVVFASSNHVMGGMLTTPGNIAADAHPSIGTTYTIPGATMDSTLYAVAKVAGETQLESMIASGRLERAIVLRIGFCQPGENKKSSLPKTGNPNKKPSHSTSSQRSDQQESKVMDWWKGMYLSNEDFGRLVERCVNPDLEKNSKKLMRVNGVSANPESRWVIDDNDICYQPEQQQM